MRGYYLADEWAWLDDSIQLYIVPIDISQTIKQNWSLYPEQVFLHIGPERPGTAPRSIKVNFIGARIEKVNDHMELNSDASRFMELHRININNEYLLFLYLNIILTLLKIYVLH